MNESETRAEHIDPALKAAGWGVVDGSRIRREYPITLGRIEGHGKRGKALTADYVLEYRNTKLAVVEAKAWDKPLTEGVGQAKDYAGKLEVRFAFATNGQGIYQIDMGYGTHGTDRTYKKEAETPCYPTPDELWNLTFAKQNAWRDRFATVPFEDRGGYFQGRYYQDIAIERVLEAIADNRQRILLTLATGTGKTFIAFQIAWKLFHSRWNLTDWKKKGEPTRRPRILFLADRNILADQAYNAFSAFPEDALVRIAPDEIKKKGKVPKNGSIFFTIFQTFMSGGSAGSPTADKQDTGSPTAGVECFEEIKEIKSGNGYMYILECADGSFYTGSTVNLPERLDQHKNGEGAEHTKRHLPVKLVYYETYDRISKAFNREKQVQGWSRAKKIALITGNTELLQTLSKCKTVETEVAEPFDFAQGRPAEAVVAEPFDFAQGRPVEAEVAEPFDFAQGRPAEAEVAEPFDFAQGRPAEAEVAEPAEAYFGDYPPDFFDFIVIDECHRGGANDESTWRDILTYFKPAVQLGLTATPKRKDNVDTYAYFGEPVYIYSLKDGINDGYLTPFRVKQISTTLDEYVYTSDDRVMEGEIEYGKRYEEPDFNKIIEIKEREKKRVEIFMSQIDQREKTLVFCANQAHALAVRDLINQMKNSTDPNYCQRVTANDGLLGEQHLRDFQDNEKTIPTILTTSQKLSTGVDARNIRNIVLMRPINRIIEFKQIIGRGTRLYDGKDYFTIYDFVKAYHHFSDPEWDGEPVEQIKPMGVMGPMGPIGPIKVEEKSPDYTPKKKAKVKLADGKERTIQYMVATSFWHPDGTPMSAQQFMEALFGKLPEFFKDEEELRGIWSVPDTRKAFLSRLAEAGFGKEQMTEMQKIIDAEKSDLFDVLAYVAFALQPVTREDRATRAKGKILTTFTDKQRAFLDFVLSQYVKEGVDELDQEKLSPLLKLKYHTLPDATKVLGTTEQIRGVFVGFQRYLYEQSPAV